MGKIKTSLLLPINRLSVSFTQPNHHQREREREREREGKGNQTKQTNKQKREAGRDPRSSITRVGFDRSNEAVRDDIVNA